MVAGICDVDIAAAIAKNALGAVEFSASGCPAVAGKADGVDTGDGGDGAGGDHQANAVVAGICDIDIA